MEIVKNCPTCDSTKQESLYEVFDYISKEKFPLVKCLDCTLLYLSKRPSVNEIEKYYQNSAGNSMRKNPNSIFKKLQEIRLKNEFKIFSHCISTSDYIVDIGCGDGALANVIHKLGHRVVGIDVFPAYHWSYQEVPYFQRNLNAFDANTLKMVLPDGNVKAVILRHNLEHLHFPSSMIDSLAKSGVKYLWIVVPNTDSFFKGILDQKWNLWDPPRHLTYFNSKSLNLILNRNNFDVIRTEFFNFDELVSSLYQHIAYNNSYEFIHKWLNPKSPIIALSSAITSVLPVKTNIGVLAKLRD
jgi:SAM-dependent methyltransferase